MENLETIKILVSDLTIEQFCQILGVAFAFFVASSFCVFIVFCFLNSYINGRLHYKTMEYYGSFRYLNKCFKNLKSSTSIQTLDISAIELFSTIRLLRYQHIIPKFIYNRLYDKCYEINAELRENFLLEVVKNEKKL